MSANVAAITLAVWVAGQARPAAHIRFHVAPNGRDTWSGRLAEPNAGCTDGPFATVTRAQAAVRAQRRVPSGPITVHIRGVHRLNAPLVFTQADSGTAACPVTYTTYPGRRCVLSGGRRITHWARGDGPIRTVRLPEVRNGTWYFRQLFVDGRRARRARHPNQGYLYVDKLVEDKPGVHWNVGVDRFGFRPGDIKPWNDLSNVEVVVFHSWNTSRVRIASVDTAADIVTFTGPTHFRPMAWDRNQRYYVENSREVLDQPGEWYLDRRTGTLSYWPRRGEDLARAHVVAPVLRELARFDGDPGAGRFVRHVRLVGLTLEHADWTLPQSGYGDAQAAVSVPAAVSASGAIACHVERCEIAHIGTYGVWFGRGCKDNRIVQNHIHDMGAGGVRIGEAEMAKHDVAEASRNLVSNNYIHGGGHVYAAGVGVWVAQSSHNTVSHNEIHSLDYSGMSIGWNWNDAPNRTHHNTIERNHIHHVMRGVLSDGGGIYTLGTQTGTVLRYNRIHDVFPYMGAPAMAWGIYFDAGSNGLRVENNICYHTLTGGIMNTAGHGNTIRNNVFALSARHAVWRWKWQKEPSSVFERNIIYLTQGQLFHADGGVDDVRSKWDHNLYWRTGGQPLRFYRNTFAQWQAKGMDRHSRVADPLFVDPGRGDFRLRTGSPALELGFKPIDMSTTGLYGPPEWVRLPQQATFPPTVLPPPYPPPVPVDDGFETTPVGQPPTTGAVSEEGRGDSVRVTDETAATGARSLKFTDAPGLTQTWNPHAYYSPRFRRGRARLDVDLRLEPGAIVWHEWRDADIPFLVGPRLHVGTDRRLVANGTFLATVPAGTWFHVQIECALGAEADGTYGLTLSLPGSPARTFGRLRCVSPEFRDLAWLGFVSDAKARTVFYVDNVKIGLTDP